MQHAEAVFEAVVDYLVRLDYGPELGELIAQSASRSAHEEALVEAFAEPVAERAGISLDEAAEEIRKGAKGFQVITRMYGEQLAKHDEAYVLEHIPVGLTVVLSCDVETAEAYVARAVEMCQDDFKNELDRVCRQVRAKMAGNPKYAVDLPARHWEP